MTDATECPHRPPCPGCPALGASVLETPAHARLTAFAAQHAVVLSVPTTASAYGFRQRARLAVRGRARSPKLGIFQSGSHRIVDIPRCLVHHPRINETARVLREAIRDTETAPYVEATGRGLLRYVQLVVERRSERVQVTLIANCESRAPLDALAGRVEARLAEHLHSLWLNFNVERSNRIVGARFEKIHGPDAVCERVAGAELFFPPDAFGQSHLGAYERLVRELGSRIPDGLDVLELYAGVGGIGLSLLPRSARVTFNEIEGGSLRGLELARARLAPELAARTCVRPGPAAALAGELSKHDVVIVDPPRRGLEPELLEGLGAGGSPRFVYVSCGLDSFLRDASVLCERGYRLESLAAHDMFPHSGHLETLAHFVRK